ncbi:MAG: DNA polymerase III subunit delta [Actinomycetes bacterium]
MGTSAPPTLTLVIGPEELFAERTADAVVAQARAVDPSTERRNVDASQDGAAGIIAEACSPTLFGGGSVVIITKAESADDSCVRAIRGAVADGGDGFALVVHHAGGAKGKKILDALASLPHERVDAPAVKSNSAVSAFVNAEVRRNKRTMSHEAQSLLIAAVGKDVRALAAACSQLAADVEGRSIDAEAVRLYFGGTAAIESYRVSDAVMGKQGSAALRLLRLAEGVDGVRSGPAIVAALASGIRQLAVISAVQPGSGDQALAREVNIQPWKIKQVRDQSRNWHSRDLARAVLQLADLDAAVKGGLRDGDQLDPVQKGLAMENAVAHLAARKSPASGR